MSSAPQSPPEALDSDSPPDTRRRRRKAVIAILAAVGVTAVLLVILTSPVGDGGRNRGGGQSRANDAPGANRITITQTNVINNLQPGMTAPESIIGTLRVSNKGTAYVGTIIPTVTGTSNPGCTAENFTTEPSNYDNTVKRVATNVVIGNIIFRYLNQNQDACKSATVYLSFTLN